MDKWILCVVFLIVGMLLANMIKNVCGCNKVVEGNPMVRPPGHKKDGICCCGDIKEPSTGCASCEKYDCFNHSDCYTKINWNSSPDFKPPKGGAEKARLCANIKDTSVGECNYVIPAEGRAGTEIHIIKSVKNEDCKDNSKSLPNGAYNTVWTETTI
jgi:hypothetical protein